MSLRTKLMVYILALTSFLLVAVSGVGYWNAQKQLTAEIDDKMGDIVERQTLQLDTWLKDKAKTIENLAFVISNTSNGEISPAYFTMDKNDKSVSDLYIGLADGKFFHGEGSPMPPGYDPRQRGWYKEAVAKNGLNFSAPYIDTTTKKYCVTPALPLKDAQGRLRGVIGTDILLETLSDMVKKITLDGKGYAFMLDAKGVVLAHPDPKVVSTNLLNNEEMKELAQQMLSHNAGALQYTFNGENKMLVYRKIPSTGWVLALAVPQAAVYAPLATLRSIYIWVGLVALLIMGVFAFVLARRITAPIQALTGNARKMAEGDLTVEAAVQGQDEIAVLSQAFNQMGNNLRQLVTEITAMTFYLTEAAAAMRRSAEEAGQVSEQIATTITEMAQDSTRQADIIQNSATMVNDMTKSITVISRNVNSSSHTAQEVQEAVHIGNTAIDGQAGLMEDNRKAAGSVNRAIDVLSAKSQQIGQIVEVITSIAGQTNLLALNAAIEAARAGEHGRGFAVVAEEVRKLAEQAGASSQEITGLIREIQAGTEEAVKEMATGAAVAAKLEDSAGISRQALDKINEAVNELAAQVREIANESQQVDSKTGEVSQSISQVAAVSENSAAATQQVAASTEEQTASVQAIAHEAQTLLEQAEKLKQTVARFKI